MKVDRVREARNRMSRAMNAINQAKAADTEGIASSFLAAALNELHAAQGHLRVLRNMKP